jgi:hypothetical protein
MLGIEMIWEKNGSGVLLTQWINRKSGQTTWNSWRKDLNATCTVLFLNNYRDGYTLRQDEVLADYGWTLPFIQNDKIRGVNAGKPLRKEIYKPIHYEYGRSKGLVTVFSISQDGGYTAKQARKS